MTTRVSLAELAAADVQLRPAEAVAFVAEICRQYTIGQLPGIPSPGIIRLTPDGEIVVQGPMTTDDASVERAAHLLNDLLPDFDAPADYRASGGLRLVIARALGTLDLPPYATLHDFSAALDRFAVPDLRATARTLFRAWDQGRAVSDPAAATAALTISDIRRARRATGLSLDDLSAVADVPVARWRELEWGYLRNWRADEEGRAGVVRYARAAGLDERVVLSIAWPMIEQASASVEVEGQPVTALVRSGPQALVTINPAAGRHARSRLASWSLAAVAIALLAWATFAITMNWVDAAEAVQAAAPSGPSVSRDAGLIEPPASAVSSAAPRPPAGRPGIRPAPSQRRPTPRTRALLGRELFRVVIR
jgi:predicted transcriptional regulator